MLLHVRHWSVTQAPDALRAILEEYMLDIMYEIPKDDNIGEVVITEGYIQGNGGPKILMRGQETTLLEG